MKKITAVLSLIVLFVAFTGIAQAYEHEVWKSGSLYYWKTFNVERGSSSELHTAINGALGSGQREVHVTCSGPLNGSVLIPSWNTQLYCHGNTFTKTFDGYGISNGWDGFELYDLTLTGGSNMGIRSSRGSNLVFENIRISNCGGIGLRIDSHPSRPYENWITNVRVENCTFENCSGHGLETYGIDGFQGYGLVARNCSECGVLLNQTINGTMGTVLAYNCSYGYGYAGLRFANTCDNITASKLYADHCGRGFFVLSGSKNCTLNSATIRDCKDQWGTGRGIWLENVTNCKVLAGCCDSGVTVTGSGSYADVSSSCSSANFLGTKKITNRASGRVLDANPSNYDGSSVGIWDYWGGSNQKWVVADVAGGMYSIRSTMSGSRGLDCAGWGISNGTNVQLYSYWGGTNQMFAAFYVGSGYYRLSPAHALSQSLEAWGTSNGSNVGTWSYWGGSNQKWSLYNP